ncbi:MAG: CinA family protein [Gammaproteobacteria bacterium]|nr:CinA family protein [Gammaproteobacteria bacterium]
MAATEESNLALAKQLGECLKEKGVKLATAESCSGGWIAKVITDLPGSSAWFEGSVVCYSNESKQDLLGVLPRTLDEFGAVSGDVVLEMTDGLFERTGADVAVSVSGIAGPDGGSDDKPVGTVWLCWGKRDKTSFAHEYHFEGDREAVRLQTVEAALLAILDVMICI